METIPLEDFLAEGPDVREPEVVIRCGCGWEECRGWAVVDANAPWGLRSYEALPLTQGPLEMNPEFAEERKRGY